MLCLGEPFLLSWGNQILRCGKNGVRHVGEMGSISKCIPPVLPLALALERLRVGIPAVQRLGVGGGVGGLGSGGWAWGDGEWGVGGGGGGVGLG